MRVLRRRKASSPRVGLRYEYRYLSMKRIAMLHDSAFVATQGGPAP